MLLVDTNVLIDVLEDEPAWADWSLKQLRAQSQVHELAINPVIYSELSLAFDSLEKLDAIVDAMGLVYQEMPRPALFLAGKAFVKYRRRGGPSAWNPDHRRQISSTITGAHNSSRTMA